MFQGTGPAGALAAGMVAGGTFAGGLFAGVLAGGTFAGGVLAGGVLAGGVLAGGVLARGWLAALPPLAAGELVTVALAPAEPTVLLTAAEDPAVADALAPALCPTACLTSEEESPAHAANSSRAAAQPERRLLGFHMTTPPRRGMSVRQRIVEVLSGPLQLNVVKH